MSERRHRFLSFGVGVVLGLVVGAALAGVAAYHYGTRFLLRDIYVDAALNVHQNVALRRKLDAGDSAGTRDILDQFLKSDVIILNGCRYDLCADGRMPMVERALKAAAPYQKRGDPHSTSVTK